MSLVFSSSLQLKKIESLLFQYLRLPFSTDSVPGNFLETTLSQIRGAKRLGTYDFIDVHHPSENVGWQIKSTKSSTPVTWKRAKIPNQEALIQESLKSEMGCKKLGDAIINFCNGHAHESFKKYSLEAIGYARLVVHSDNKLMYFERELCTKDKPDIFNTADFSWHWSTRKKTVKKEQLEALHGIHIPTGEKWWAWHGLGENQLHFSGERNWWPADDSKSHARFFSAPTDDEKLSLEKLTELLSSF